MDYNLAGIRNRVLVDKLDDDEFDPNIVDNFINDTQRDIFNQFELTFQEKIFSGTVPSGSVIFAMPSDAALVQSRVLTAPDGSQTDMKSYYLPFREFNRHFPTPGNNTAAKPTYWTSYAGNVMLSAPTDQIYTFNTFYIKKPITLTEDTSVPEIPEEFSELLVLGAFIRILKRNEDFDLAAQESIEYQRILTLLVNRYGFRAADGPIKMKNQQI